MKDYSYTELKEMQDRAMERVRAMQQRASETVSRENSLQEEKPKPDAHTEQNSYTKPHHIKMPVNMPPRESAEKAAAAKQAPTAIRLQISPRQTKTALLKAF